MHAINAKTGKRIWRFEADNEVNTSAAYWQRPHLHRLGQRHALLAQRQDRQAALERAVAGPREFWYATPTVAYGRVYIGNTDGTMYVFGAKSGRLLWARPLGSYIYGAAAVYRRRVFVGTYDGKFYALDAATGDVRWEIDAHGAVHAAPTVMDGLVYYAVCSSCGSEAQRAVARGPDATYAVRAARRHARCGASRRASTRTRWSPTRSASTSPAARTSSRSPAKGSKVGEGLPERARAAKRRREERAARSGERRARRAAREKRSNASGHVPRASREARGSPLTWSEWSRPGSSSTSSAGLSGTVPSPQVGSAGLPTSSVGEPVAAGAPPRSPAGSGAA